MTGMDTLTQDWGTKWNRIKSAALSIPTSTNAGGVKSVQRGYFGGGTYSYGDPRLKIAITPVDVTKSVLIIDRHTLNIQDSGEYHYNGTASLSSNQITVHPVLYYAANGSERHRASAFSWQVVEYY